MVEAGSSNCHRQRTLVPERSHLRKVSGSRDCVMVAAVVKEQHYFPELLQVNYGLSHIEGKKKIRVQKGSLGAVEPPTRRCAHLRGWRLRLTVLGPAAGSPGARHEEPEPRPPGQHLASRVGVFRFRNPGSSQAPRPSPGNNRRSGPEFPAARFQAAPWVPQSLPRPSRVSAARPGVPAPRAAPRPGLPTLQCLGPRSCRGSSLSSHPAPPSLRRAGAPGPPILRAPPPALLTARSRAAALPNQPPTPRRGGRGGGGGGASRTSRSAHPAHPAHPARPAAPAALAAVSSSGACRGRFRLDQLLVDQHRQLSEGCESASRPINPSPYSHDEFTSAVRASLVAQW
ncbi:TPA: hypothetical protein BOS_4096 [Bos taurus]|nr:TPA: hypothetical protein BOS_4096 [Bos taurus]